MAIPIISIAARAILGGVKTAIKTAAKNTVKDIAQDLLSGKIESSVLVTAKTTGKKALEKFIQGKITNSEALLINRLKTKPTNALYNLVSSETGIPQSALRKMVKSFKQSAKAKEISKGIEFRKNLISAANSAKKSVLKDIGLSGKNFTLKTLERKAREYVGRLKNLETDINYNITVFKMLDRLEDKFTSKVHGISQATDKMQITYTESTKIIQYFDSSVDYTKETIDMLELLSQTLDNGFELGSDTNDVWVTEVNDGEFEVYSARFIKTFILDFKSDVETTLINTSVARKNDKVQSDT